MQLLSTLAALSAVVTTTQAAKAFVYNHCSYDIYLWAVDTERNPQSPSVVKAGQVWSENYYTPREGGVSVKLSKTPSRAVVTQFEYTLNSAAIWYDGSNIDCIDSGCPWANENLMIMSSNSGCPSRTCSPSTGCTGFYLKWNDDLATLSCDTSADTEFHVCLPGGQMPGGGSPVVSASSVANQAAGQAASAASNGAGQAASAVGGAPVVKAAVSAQVNEAVAPMARSPSPRAVAVNPRHLHGHALVHARANKL